MTFNDPYEGGEVVFTRSAKNITLKDAGEEPVRFIISVNDDTVGSFLAIPVAGEVILHLKDILTALEDKIKFPLISQGDIIRNISTVTIKAGDDAIWDHYVFPGGADSMMISNCPVLTARPQKARTFTDGIERHVTKWDVPTGGIKLECRLRFQTGVPQDIQILYNKASGTVIEDADVSYKAIREAADNEGYESERITSYSIRPVYTIIEKPPHQYGPWQHFIVCHGRHHQYLFRNHYGAIDTIYAVGQLARSVDSEISTFLSERTERELTNDAVVKYEQNSGYLISNEEVRFWSEFFRSKERYAVVSGEIRPIVVDSISMEAKGDEVNSVKFQWHYSELDTYDEAVRTDEEDITIPGTNIYL
ncbi:MAG: hypothetical protein ACI3Z0_05350 [Candidatus Cryptobacteroides sp.]